MKHIFIATFIALVTLTSCGVVSKAVYGDITLMDDNGQIIRQYDNSVLQYEEMDIATGKKTSSTYPIKDGGGIIFSDSKGESHYIHGGIIIVDNIRNSSSVDNIKNSSEPVVYNNQDPEFDLNQVKYDIEELNQQISEKKKYLEINGDTMKPKEYMKLRNEIKDLKKQKRDLETILTTYENQN